MVIIKCLVLIVVFFGMPENGYTQSEKPVNKLVDSNQLVGKWVLVKMARGETSTVIPEKETNVIVYNINGTYSDSSSLFKYRQGTWSYDSTTQVITTTEIGGKSKLKVIKVTDKELIINLKEKDFSIDMLSEVNK